MVTDDFVVACEGAKSGPPSGKKPDRFVPVAGPDGEAIRDARGRPVMVDTLNPNSSTLGEVISSTRTVSNGQETLALVGR